MLGDGDKPGEGKGALVAALKAAPPRLQRQDTSGELRDGLDSYGPLRRAAVKLATHQVRDPSWLALICCGIRPFSPSLPAVSFMQWQLKNGRLSPFLLPPPCAMRPLETLCDASAGL